MIEVVEERKREKHRDIERWRGREEREERDSEIEHTERREREGREERERESPCGQPSLSPFTLSPFAFHYSQSRRKRTEHLHRYEQKEGDRTHTMVAGCAEDEGDSREGVRVKGLERD